MILEGMGPPRFDYSTVAVPAKVILVEHKYSPPGCTYLTQQKSVVRLNYLQDGRALKTSNQLENVEKISRLDLRLETTVRLAKLVAICEPGTRLPTERELCEKLGVGRSTLREAIRSLAFIGAIYPRQGSGTYVTALEDQTVERLISLGITLQRATVQEIIEARRALEIDAVRMAAARYTQSDRHELEAVMQAMIASSADPVKASRYDLQYHVTLATASHNSVLVHFINGMRALLEMWMTKAVNRIPVVEEIVREHNSVLEAVFDRNPDKAAARMDLHLEKAAERLLSVVGKDQSMADYLFLLLTP